MQLCFCDVILNILFIYFLFFSIIFSHFPTYGNCACFKMNHNIIQFCAVLRMLDSKDVWNVGFETTLDHTEFHYIHYPITFYDIKFALNLLIFTRQAHISKAVIRHA